MKINLVLGHQLAFPPLRGGGVENLNWMLAKEYARLGHEVVAYSRAAENLAARETDSHGIRHIRARGYDLLPNLWLDHLNALRWMFQLIPLLEPADVTSFHTPFSFLLRHRRGLGVCTHTIHRTPKRIVPLYRGLDRVYCGSDAVVQQARAIDPRIDNLKRVHNCIAIPADAQPPLSRPPGASLLFLYVGRFVEDKGLASLVEGFKSSLKDHPQNRLKTVGPQLDGDGADTAFFRRMSEFVNAGKLQDKIEFMPPIFDKAKLNALIAGADVICVPTLTGETFSMAVLEGMALAKPLLVSDFGPMPEAVEHLVTGYVARADDATDIARGMAFFSTNAADLSRLGNAGFEKAKRCFSVEKIAREYLEDFETLRRRITWDEASGRDARRTNAR